MYKRQIIQTVISESEDDLVQGTKLVIRDGQQISLLDIDEIVWIDAAGDYMCIHAGESVHVLRSTMKALTPRLEPFGFARVHRSTLVNLQCITSAVSLPKGEYKLSLDQKTEIKTGRKYKEVVQSYLTSIAIS